MVNNCGICMICSENHPINACGKIFSERSTYTTIFDYEFSHREPKCVKRAAAGIPMLTLEQADV